MMPAFQYLHCTDESQWSGPVRRSTVNLAHVIKLKIIPWPYSLEVQLTPSSNDVILATPLSFVVLEQSWALCCVLLSNFWPQTFTVELFQKFILSWERKEVRQRREWRGRDRETGLRTANPTMVRQCIRLTRLILVCEVIRYRLVQVQQNLKKSLAKILLSLNHQRLKFWSESPFSIWCLVLEEREAWFIWKLWWKTSPGTLRTDFVQKLVILYKSQLRVKSAKLKTSGQFFADLFECQFFRLSSFQRSSFWNFSLSSCYSSQFDLPTAFALKATGSTPNNLKVTAAYGNHLDELGGVLESDSKPTLEAIPSYLPENGSPGGRLSFTSPFNIPQIESQYMDGKLLKSDPEVMEWPAESGSWKGAGSF